MATVTAKLEKSGRVLIPAENRRQLNLMAGSEILLRVDDTGLTLGTREQALDSIRKRLREFIPPDRILSEELTQERRAEFEKENQR